jgi:hypothetical protein
MNRRAFLAVLAAVPAAAIAGVKVPSPLGSPCEAHGLLDVDNDGTYGTWAGIERSTYPFWRAGVVGATGAFTLDTMRSFGKAV